MVRAGMVWLAVVMVSMSAWGQPPAAPPPRDVPAAPPGEPRPQPANPPAPVDQKLRYICKQLELTAEQRQNVEGLFAILEQERNLTGDELARHVEEIRAKYQEMMAAQSAGDMALAEKLRDELRNMAPGKMAADNFVRGIMPLLTDAQKAKFNTLLAQLETVASLELQPIQVLRLARGLDLTANQRKSIDRIEGEFRQTMTQTYDLTAAKKSELLDQLILNVGAVLTDVQRTKWILELDRLRPDPLPAPAADAGHPSPPNPVPATQPSPNR